MIIAGSGAIHAHRSKVFQLVNSKQVLQMSVEPRAGLIFSLIICIPVCRRSRNWSFGIESPHIKGPRTRDRRRRVSRDDGSEPTRRAPTSCQTNDVTVDGGDSRIVIPSRLRSTGPWSFRTLCKVFSLTRLSDSTN